MDAIIASFEAMRRQLAEVIEAELAAVMPSPATASGPIARRSKLGPLALLGALRRKPTPPLAAKSWDEILVE